MTRVRAAVVALLLLLPAGVVAALGPAPGAAAAPQSAEARADTYTVTGRVVRLSNGRPVHGVRVTAYEVAPLEPRGSALTDGDGRFVIRGLELRDSEVGVYVNGTRVGFAKGWLGCDRTLKATWGDACSHGIAVGRVRITRA